MEIALDLALQCAPDHPWVTAHPEWFTTRPDGTIAYAENPPKKYQDIYPLNFDNDPKGLYAECLRIVRHWIAAGVTIFRVDNPHTKPLNFWQWLIGEVRKTDPDVLFLAEAFTRPAMMHELAKVGFHQSYTYFTWRNTKEELEEYGAAAGRVGALHAAELLRQHAGHPATSTCVHGGPGRVRDPRGARRDAVADLGRLLRLRAVRAPQRASPAARSTSTRRSTSCGRVTTPARWPTGARSRRCSPGSTRSAASTRRCTSCATCASTSRQPRHHRVQQARRGHRRHRPRRLHHQPARGARGDDRARPAGARHRLGQRLRGASTCSTGAEYHWGEFNYVRLDPHHRPAHIFQVLRT